MGFEKTVTMSSRRDGVERIIVVGREDGLLTYKKQAAGRDGTLWGNPGPACGVYDSPETAIAETKQRVWWQNSDVAYVG